MEDKRLQKHEYEVFADAHIEGEFKYQSYSFRPWDIGNLRLGEKRLLCLRINESSANEGMKPRNVSEFVQLAPNLNLYNSDGLAILIYHI